VGTEKSWEKAPGDQEKAKNKGTNEKAAKPISSDHQASGCGISLLVVGEMVEEAHRG
jgi:hypothetical protein